MAPTIPVSTMTSTHTSLVPVRYIESSGTRMASTSAQIHITANERNTKTIHSSNAGTSFEPPFGSVSYVTDLPL